MTNADFRCGVCTKKFVNDKKKQYEHQRRKGCFGPVSSGMFYRPDFGGFPRFDVSRCFSAYFSNGFAELINLLPTLKTDLDTPSRIAELSDLVDNLIEERNREQQKLKDRLTRGK